MHRLELTILRRKKVLVGGVRAENVEVLSKNIKNENEFVGNVVELLKAT